MPKEKGPIAETTATKYRDALRRLREAGLDLDDTKGVLAWFAEKKLGGSAIKTYLSAIKNHYYEINKKAKENNEEEKKFPLAYQDEINRLYGDQNQRDKEQKLTPKQEENYATFPELREAQRRLAGMEGKTQQQWIHYVLASLYTLNAPVRADYGDMKVFGRRDARRTTGNELIWSGKPTFIFREYKTSKKYGTVEIAVSKELRSVLAEWFAHLGSTPKYLLGTAISPNHLSTQLTNAFISTGKSVAVNLLRHAYIQYHLPPIATHTIKREDLARRMLHSTDRQQAYFTQNV
jgi:hypothetical protein